ncbi:hypothetical protein ACQ86N_43550 [Puia sp. P3]|uniref:hypothetical protein n=1 Tax=Puia sp. P3 TaxID=3423952 RepID=UPI003D66544C
MGGDAVLVAEMEEPASLAAQMMTIYKDERLRRELIEKGGARVAEFRPQRSLGRHMGSTVAGDHASGSGKYVRNR